MGEKGVDFWFSHLLGVADIVEKYETLYPTAIASIPIEISC